MKIAVITCYKQPDYVRARTLRTAFAAAPDVEVLIIRNRRHGIWRFIEVPLKILKARWRDQPDAYVITFRGYEMLLYMVLTLVRKPIIFDELINFTEWMEEHGKLKAGSRAYRLFRRWNAAVVRHARFILADTEAHARHSASLNRLRIDRYRTIPVGTDETVFYRREVEKSSPGIFTVFYYGSMLPLHGLDYVLEAARLLKDQRDINFRFVGGGTQAAQACAAAVQAGARIKHEAWLPVEELPTAALQAGLTMGGPFGNTTQSQFVITGKTYQFLALGTPVLIGQNEVSGSFQDKDNCLMVPQADAPAIAEAVLWASRHPQELAQIGQAGRQLYEKQFSQTIVTHLAKSIVGGLAKNVDMR